jgi:hypothetical protein
MPVDHFCLPIPAANFESTLSFLTTSLASLRLKEIPGPVAGLSGVGENGKVDIWFVSVSGEVEDYKKMLKGVHFAFTAESKSFSS